MWKHVYRTMQNHVTVDSSLFVDGYPCPCSNMLNGDLPCWSPFALACSPGAWSGQGDVCVSDNLYPQLSFEDRVTNHGCDEGDVDVEEEEEDEDHDNDEDDDDHDDDKDDVDDDDDDYDVDSDDSATMVICVLNLDFDDVCRTTRSVNWWLQGGAL